MDAGSERSKGSGESGLVVVENQETRGHDASDGRAGESVRHPNVVVDALDGFGLRPRVLRRPDFAILYYCNYYRCDSESFVGFEVQEHHQLELDCQCASRFTNSTLKTGVSSPYFAPPFAAIPLIDFKQLGGRGGMFHKGCDIFISSPITIDTIQ